MAEQTDSQREYWLDQSLRDWREYGEAQASITQYQSLVSLMRYVLDKFDNVAAPAHALGDNTVGKIETVQQQPQSATIKAQGCAPQAEAFSGVWKPTTRLVSQPKRKRLGENKLRTPTKQRSKQRSQDDNSYVPTKQCTNAEGGDAFVSNADRQRAADCDSKAALDRGPTPERVKPPRYIFAQLKPSSQFCNAESA